MPVLSFPERPKNTGIERETKVPHNAGGRYQDALMREIEERIEFLNFAYLHFDTDEYMKVILEKRPFTAPPNGRTPHD